MTPSKGPGPSPHEGFFHEIHRRSPVHIPLNEGSCCRIRVRIPSVTTSMRVLAANFLIQSDTVSHSFSHRLFKCVMAIRCAAARAASLRGSSMTRR